MGTVKSKALSRVHDIVDIALILLAIITRDTFSPLGGFLRLAGGFIFVAGASLAFVSARQLRQAAPHSLLTSGLYSYVRHPYYLGTLTALIGLTLGLLSLWGLIFAITIAPFVAVIHAREEERELSGRFGQRWDEYAEKVPFILPGLLGRH
jgi:protein-S-isoprenylcysteine O-methyltransferase Ste14